RPSRSAPGAGGRAAPAPPIHPALVFLCGLQQGVRARPALKVGWPRFAPPPIERSTYVLASSAVLIALFAFWRPIPEPVWHTEGATAAWLTAGLFAGVGMVLLSTLLIDHFDLFGLRQVVLHFRGQPYEEKRFATPFLYKWIRHPLYV